MHSRKPIQRDLSDNLDSLSQPYLEDQALILCDTKAITIHTWSACLIETLSLNVDKSSGDAFHILSTTL